MCEVLGPRCRLLNTDTIASLSPMRDSLHLLRAFAKKPSKIGAVFPSSSALARRMLADFPLDGDAAVLELGPGTGPFTKILHARMKDPGRYLGIDLEAGFVQLLRLRFPSMRFVCGSAHQADLHLDAHSIRNVRLIISGLPFAALSVKAQQDVMECLGRLFQPGMEFRTFQYIHMLGLPSAKRFRHEMDRRFGPVCVSRPILWNIPPAVILTWRRHV